MFIACILITNKKRVLFHFLFLFGGAYYVAFLWPCEISVAKKMLTVYQSWKNTERSVPALTHWPGFISWRSKWNPRRGDHTWGGISYEATHVLNADEALQERSTKVIWLTSWLLCQARNVPAHKCGTQVHTTEVQRHLTHRSKSFLLFHLLSLLLLFNQHWQHTSFPRNTCTLAVSC